MKFNYKGRGFVVVTLAAMLVVVGTVNYQLSRKSLLETSKEFTAYEQAQNEKNTDTDDKEEVKVVDSKENQVEEKVTEASKQIEKQLTSEKNMKKATYILDMKMTREKQRNSLTQDLNEMINNPSTSEEARKEASSMKIQLVKDQEAELKISSALEAAEKLAADGIDAKIINIHTIKPLDEELIVAAAKETGKVVTVEEHSVIGGLGSAVCDALAEKCPVPVKKIGVQDVFGESGPAVALLAKYKLDGEGVYEQVKEFCK